MVALDEDPMLEDQDRLLEHVRVLDQIHGYLGRRDRLQELDRAIAARRAELDALDAQLDVLAQDLAALRPVYAWMRGRPPVSV